MAGKSASPPKRGRPPGRGSATTNEVSPTRRSLRQAAEPTAPQETEKDAAKSALYDELASLLPPAPDLPAKATKVGGAPRSPGRPRKEPPSEIATDPHTAEKVWTDSPQKKSPVKGKPGMTRPRTWQQRSSLSKLDAACASLGSIRESIETHPPTEPRTRSRSKSPARATEARTGSRSRSPAKATETRNGHHDTLGTAGTQRYETRSTSPSKEAFSAALTKVYGKPKPLKSIVARSSTSKATKSKSPSPSRSASREGARTRSISPAKMPQADGFTEPLRSGHTSRSKSASPIRGRPPSPKKPVSPPKARAVGRTPKSPVRPDAANESTDPSHQHAEQLLFLNKFAAENRYGQVLRSIEAQAYESTKAGTGASITYKGVTRVDGTKAVERGNERAYLEESIHELYDQSRRHKQAKEPASHSPKSRSTSQEASSRRSRKPKDRSYRPEATDAGDAVEEELYEVSPPAEHRSKSTPKPSKRASPSKRTSPSKRASPSKASNAPLSAEDSDSGGLNQPTSASSRPRRTSANKDKGDSWVRERNVASASSSGGAANPAMGKEPNRQTKEPSGRKRGTVHSVTNPELIPGTQTKNPFFETMPAPEVWHRRMPPYFPFGETPFMRRVMSKEMSDDLAKGREEQNATSGAPGLLSRMASSVSSLFWSSPSKQYPSPWALPAVSQAAVNEIQEGMKAQRRKPLGSPTKRKRADAQVGRDGSAKRVRQHSREEYLMSGAL